MNVSSVPVSTNDWFAIPKPSRRARMRLFCFPYAGVGASAYGAWSRMLPSDVELCSIQLPGRESRLREAPYTSLADLLEELMVLLPTYLDRPFALFGHSMGAIIGFEVARQLRRNGLASPFCLLVSAHRAPQLSNPDPPLHMLSDSALVDELQVRYHGIPRIILEDADLLSLFLPTLRADFEMLETYRYQDERPFGFPIAAFGGREDGYASEEELMAWGSQSGGGFSLQLFPGDHFYVQSATRSLLSVLVSVLNQSFDH